jgi:4-methylaminobutanoate oxidase (formaldehyde-forming)
LTSFSKYLLQGPHAESALQRLCANNVEVPPGTTVYTGLLNARGTYESDLTVARLGADRFLLVTGTAQTTRDADWIARHLPKGAALTDVTADYAVIAVMGPRARDLLARLTEAPLGNGAFPFGAIREIVVAGVTLWASRRTYVGELGWELYVPAGQAGAVYDALCRRAPRSVSAMPVTMRSSRCGSRRATAPGAAN